MTTTTLAEDRCGRAIQVMGIGVAQTVTTATGAAAAIATALGTGTTVIRLLATTDCWIAVGVGAGAVANSGLYLVGGVPEYFSVTPANGNLVSALAVASAGLLNVTEMA